MRRGATLTTTAVTAGIALERARETCFGRMQASLLHFGVLGQWSGVVRLRPKPLHCESSGAFALGRVMLRTLALLDAADLACKKLLFRLIAQKS